MTAPAGLPADSGVPRIRRVVLTLDSTSGAPGVLDTLAGFAAGIGSELVGVFVSYADLLRSAELPFTRTVRLPTGALEPLDRAATVAEIERRASRARREIARAAVRARARHAFIRLASVAELAGVVGEVDILVQFAAAPARRLVPAPEAPTGAARGFLLVLHPAAALAGPLSLIYEDSPAGERALRLAAHLARTGGGHPLVVAGTGTAPPAAMRHLTDLGVEAVWHPVPADDTDTLHAALGEPAGLAILPAERAARLAPTPTRLVTDVLRRSALLVR